MLPDFFSDPVRRFCSVCEKCHHFIPVNFRDGRNGWGCSLTAIDDRPERFLPFEAVKKPDSAERSLRQYGSAPADESCVQYMHLFMSGDEPEDEFQALANRKKEVWSSIVKTTVGELPVESLAFFSERKMEPAKWRAEHAGDDAYLFGEGGSFLWCGMDAKDARYDFEPAGHPFLTAKDARRMRFIWKAADDDERMAMLSLVFLEANRRKADIVYATTMKEDGCDGILERAGFAGGLFQTGCGKDGGYAQVVQCRSTYDTKDRR